MLTLWIRISVFSSVIIITFLLKEDKFLGSNLGRILVILGNVPEDVQDSPPVLQDELRVRGTRVGIVRLQFRGFLPLYFVEQMIV